ncbi:MAG TPA: class I SAM-dependent methyltransferase [Sphingomonas sp.]|nr:class I SAM-dependent methyltransferase [Sphingomonas sp.]
MTFGTFIQPHEQDRDAEDLAARLQIPIYSGYKARNDVEDWMGQNRVFDAIARKVRKLKLAYEDQCSAKYYFDLVRSLRDLNGEFDRVVEVGVFMGGSSSFLAGCIEPFDFDLDLVDIDANYLRFAYERVRRMYPDAARRIRLFHGDLPSYVRTVMLGEIGRKSIIHHDGAHDFEQVVKDMASLYYVREQIHAIIAQDTHLRGTIKHMNFVDMALYAVFGTELVYAPIGTAYAEHDSRTEPNRFQGNYFMPGVPEGVVIPMAANRFHYPHPALSIDDFLPAPAASAAAA